MGMMLQEKTCKTCGTLFFCSSQIIIQSTISAWIHPFSIKAVRNHIQPVGIRSARVTKNLAAIFCRRKKMQCNRTRVDLYLYLYRCTQTLIPYSYDHVLWWRSRTVAQPSARTLALDFEARLVSLVLRSSVQCCAFFAIEVIIFAFVVNPSGFSSHLTARNVVRPVEFSSAFDDI